MIRLLQWLGGYVNFQFSKGFIEGFINDCYEHRINVQSLSKDGTTLAGQCSARTYLHLHKIARKNGGIVEIVEKHGPIFAFLKMRNRWGIFVGLLCAIFVINFLSGFVWNVEIAGINEISKAEMQLFLEENGLQIGSYARNIDRDVVENLIMSSFDKCAWAHINIDGTTATVEIDETVDKPDVVDTSIVTNVKAIKDGIIIKATTYDGWQNIHVGDSVVEGDLLISGVYEGEGGKRNLFAHARGEIIAKVNEKVDLTISRKQCKKSYTDSKKFKYLYFFGIKIPLFIGSSNYINSDINVEYNYVKLNKKSLPFGVITKYVNLFSVDTVSLSDNELNKLANNEIEKYISKEFENNEIISKDLDIVLNANEAKIKGNIVCLEQIGREYKINMKK